jgi:type VI secretion system protein VasG
MSEIRRSVLFGKLDPIAYQAVESAATFCKMRGNPNIELTHWLNQVLQLPDSDLHRIIRAYGIDSSRLAADLTTNLDKLPRGATSISDISPHLEQAVERGWVYASLLFGQSVVRTGHIVIGLMKTPGLTAILPGISAEFRKVSIEALCNDYAEITSGSPEDQSAAAIQSGPASAGGVAAPAALGKQEALAKFTVDLTERARKGEIDPVLGRDDEMRQIVDILMRRRQNNPILTGEAGVGKTAVVEGFALRIAAGDVPPAMKNVVLRSLDLGLLQAGAGVKGEFENRLKQVIEEVQASPTPIILFIDEAHTLIGAGGAAGQGDAANLLKPALARGTLRTIAATTWAEYKKYFEKDPALTRRFQTIKVEEPTEEKTVVMIRGLMPVLEKHHKVDVLDEALEAAAQLSHRYIPARQLPDKAVSLIDTACARVAISLNGIPAQVEDSRRRIENLRVEQEILGRETQIGEDHEKKQASLVKSLGEEKERLDGLEKKWKSERDLVTKISAITSKLGEGLESAEPAKPAKADGNDKGRVEVETAPAAATAVAPEEREKMLAELKTLSEQLAAVQGDSPLVLQRVDKQAVASVVADWTGIPVGRMVKNEIQAVLKLADTLEQRIIGQRFALDTIAKRIQTARAGLDNPTKPIGVFMLAGPSGVGKTETALAIAEAMYGGEANMITINMSEFQEAHTVSTLKGSPPGYVGYGEGGVLTEAVRRRPYSVILLDEIEKAHKDVHELFFQVFDKGNMEDGEGRVIDFKNTVILLTTNVGSDLIINLCKDPEMKPTSEGIAQALRPQLLKAFPAALLGRLVVIPYYPLSDEMLKLIIKLQLSRIQKRVTANYDVPMTYDDDLIMLVASRCTEIESGGRAIDAILTQTLLPEISEQFLKQMMDGGKITKVHVTAKDDKFDYQFN